MMWIPNGFQTDSKRIPFAYIRNVTLRHYTLRKSNALGLASKSKSSSSVTREARDVLELRARHAK
jgi:hypothetical protein